MRRPLIAGNWKMNGDPELAGSLINACKQAVRDHESVDLAVFPPYTLLPLVATEAGGGRVRVGAQDLSPHQKGAYTGEVSASMIKATGATMVLIGHSERRQWHQEGPKLLSAKLKRALDEGLTPIYCVGESLQQREENRTEAVVGQQLALLKSAEFKPHLSEILIAYEPVWAIGTGKTATPEQAQAVHAYIRGILHKVDARISGLVRILYGGSVTPESASGLLACADIDGALVGGASLKGDAFAAIAAAAS